MSYWNRFPEYVPVARKKEKAAKKLKELLKKSPGLMPVVLEGKSIARTWWGKAWNRNLEQYADYSNRIGRGRSYVRHGTVLDLRIEPGEIQALVQGSRSKPYKVSIKIAALQKNIWKEIRSACEGMLESLQELIEGKFPKALGEVFTAEKSGMFPSPKEITFSCSCPDWAYMCKHVSAVLYGTGARLDEDPKLFFTLRKAEIGDLIQQAVAGKADKLLAKAAGKSSRIIDESDLSAVFGIDLEEHPTAGRNKNGTRKEKRSREKKTVTKKESNEIASKAPAKSAKGKKTTTLKTAAKSVKGKKGTTEKTAKPASKGKSNVVSLADYRR
ncbi:MAG: SWIM zinc finger family protein [Nitrospirota bacterium]